MSRAPWTSPPAPDDHARVEHNTVDALSSVQCPRVAIGGRDDIFTPPWMAEEIVPRAPKCDLHLYAGAGHALHREWLEDFNPRVLKWLVEK